MIEELEEDEEDRDDPVETRGVGPGRVTLHRLTWELLGERLDLEPTEYRP